MEMHSRAEPPVSGEVIKAVYAKALKEARETIRMTLRERLLRFSFVAHVVSFLNRHGIESGFLYSESSNECSWRVSSPGQDDEQVFG